jgi:protein TonB
VIETVSREHLLTKVEPAYPPKAEATRIEGDVIFRIVIGKNGKVKEIHMQRGRPILIEAAAKALSEWKYKSFTLNGEPVEVETLATVQFRLRGMHQSRPTDN